MTVRSPIRLRPFTLFVIVSVMFIAGILVERSGRWLARYSYTPAGLEKTFAPFWETWDLVEKHYVDRSKVEPKRMTRGAIDGMLVSLGDVGHTAFMSPDDFQELESGLKGKMVGIGARIIMRKRQPVFLHTLAGSPARAAGLRSGDVLLEVDGKSVAGLPLESIIEKVHGKAGTSVHLRINREGSPEPIDLELVRAEVDIPEITWALLPGVPVAHVAIQTFGQKAHALLKTALEQAREQGAKALVLDVRGNGGGLKDQAVAVTSEFLLSGNVFVEQDAHGKRTALPVTGGGTATDVPLCVLIDGGSASSAEIFAGAIQDHRRGKLVGMRTFGTGTVLEAFRLHDGSAVLLAVAEWLTPNGRRIWHKGIQPDVEVSLPEGALILLPETETELTPASLEKSEDKQLLRALEVLKAELR
jgi:carboxyl-terminal processing protease